MSINPRRLTADRFRRLRLEPLENRQLLAADWRNPVDALDVNNDRQISAFDALAIVNELNLNGVHALSLPKPAAEPFLDVNNNGGISAFDALQVINLLNTLQSFPTYQLVEQSNALMSQFAITVTTGGVSAGNRLYQFKVQPAFDLSDTKSANEDEFLAYLVNPATGQTVIDSGTRGGALFSLAGSKTELHSGLVKWDGTFVTIDLSQINVTDTLELRLQLLNLDADGGSRVTVTPWNNTLDAAGVPLSPGPNRPLPNAPGTAVDANLSYPIPGLNVELANISYQATTNRFTAEARLRNESTTPVTPGVISFTNLPAGVAAVNASGTSGGVPYWSFAGVPGVGPVAPQGTSPWIKIELDAPGNAPLNLSAEVRGSTSCGDLAMFSIFCGTFTNVSEQFIAKIPTQLHDDFLVVPLRWPTPAPTSRLVNSFDVVISNTPPTLAGPYRPISASLPEYQVQLTAQAPGDFAFAVHDLESVEVLEPGDRRSGIFDYRRGPQVYAFEGVAGQRVQIDNLLPPGTARLGAWQLVDEDGATNSDPSLPAGDYELTLTTNGRHYLIFSPPDNTTATTAYDFVVRAPVTVPHPLVFDTLQTATITTYAQRHAYSFTGSLNQQIIIDSLLPGTSPARFSLLNPRGVEVAFTPELPVVLDVAGTWQLIVRGDQPGTVPFRVLDVANLPTAGNGTNVGGTVSAVEPDFYRLPMVAGQRLSLTQNTGDVFALAVTGASGQVLTATSPANFAVPESGTGVLRLSRSGSTPEDRLYSYTVGLTLGGTVTASGFNTEHTGTLADAQTIDFPFTAAAGTPIVIDWLLDPGLPTAMQVFLLEPDGNQFFYGRDEGTKDSDVIVLNKSGTYRVILTFPGGIGNSYGFRVLDLSQAPLIAMGDAISGTLTDFRTLARRIDPEIGDQLFLETLLNGAGPFATARVYQSTAFEFPYETDRDNWVTKFTSTQPHYVLIEQNTADSTPISIQTHLLQNAETLALGTPIAVSLPAETGKLFKFQAQPGRKFFIDSVNALGDVNFWFIGDGGGTRMLPGRPLLRDFTTAGEQYVWVENFTNVAANYTFVATFLTTDSTPLTLNVAHTAVLNSLGERKVFTFTGQEGDLLYFDGLDPLNAATRLRLIEPQTGDHHPFDLGAGDFSTAEHEMYELPRTGEYSIVIGDDVGTFDFRVVNVRNAPLVPLDTTFSGSIPASLAATVWRFHASQLDQKLYVDSNATAAMPFASSMYLYKSNGHGAGHTITSIDNDLAWPTVDRTGDWYLVTPGTETPFNYDLRIRTPDVNTLPATLGSLISGQMDIPTEIDEYTFTGARGQRIVLDRVNTFNTTITLLKPDGTALSTAGDHSYLLPEAGSYRVQVTNPYPQPYQFYLLDANTQPLLPLDTPITGSTTAPDVRFFRLPAVTGQRFFFDAQTLSGATTDVRWLLYSPQGTEVFDSAFLGGDQTVTLAETGNYLLALRAPSGAINYAFQVNTIPQTPVAPSGLDQTYSGNIPASQSVNVAFTANAGQRIYLDVLDRSTFQPAVRLFGPGDVVITSSITQDGWLTIPLSGNYRLQLTSSSSATTYSLRLTDAEQLTPIVVGAPFPISLDQAHESLLWSFDATVGDLRLMELAQVAVNGSFTMQRPDGTSINISAQQHAPTIRTMTQTGRHVLVLKGTTLSTPVTGSALLWDPLQTALIAPNTTISGQLSPASEYHLYGIQLTAGERIYVEPTAWSSPNAGDWTVFDPSGAGLASPSPNNLSSPFAFTAQKTGKYILLLTVGGSGVFDYAFSFKKVAVSEATAPPYDHGFGD